MVKDSQRGTWSYTVDLPRLADGKRRQAFRRGFRTRKEAADALDALLLDVREGATATGKSTVGKFIVDRWLPAMDADPNLKATTKAGHRNMAKHVVSTTYGIGSVKLATLEGDDLTKLYARLRIAGKSERTVRLVHTTLSKALGDAVRWRLIRANPAREAIAPAQPRATPEAWTPEQMRVFLTAASSNRWATLFRVLAATGARRGEVVALRWTDIDTASGVIVISRSMTVVGHEVIEGTPKSGKPRRVPIDTTTVEALKAWSAQLAAERLSFGKGWAGDDRVFVWEDGTALHPNVLTRTFNRIVADAGLPAIRLHGLRHTWATNALRAGVAAKTVSDRLGHSSIRVTLDVYTAPVEEADRDASDRVAALYS